MNRVLFRIRAIPRANRGRARQVHLGRHARMGKMHLNFNGYWLDMNGGKLRERRGVFCVYACNYFARDQTVAPCRLLYIGDAHSARERILAHPRRRDWLKLADPGMALCYSFAPVILERKRAAAALILK